MPLKKCVAIINFWDGEDLLPYAVAQWDKCDVDVMIVFSNTSNYGQMKHNTGYLRRPEFKDCHLVHCEPLATLNPTDNERRKRNYGLQKARELGYSHFITADADEFYEPFKIDWNLDGTVVKCQTYFKNPTLTIGLDTTLVPFVHKLTPTIEYAFNRRYPFAWEGLRTIRIDPTRSFNITSGVVMNEEIIMHHMSWVRKDIKKKIFNSSARSNIEKSSVLEDLLVAKDGEFCKFYGKRLYTVENRFNLPMYGELSGEVLQSVASAVQKD